MNYINRMLVLLFFIVVPYGHAYNYCQLKTDFTAELNTSTETYTNTDVTIKQNNIQVTERDYYISVEEPGYVEINITSPSGYVFFDAQTSSCYDPSDEPGVTLSNSTSTSFYTGPDLDFNIDVYPISPDKSGDYEYTITVKYTTVRDAYMAADICYSDPTTSPLCPAGSDCNTTIPILNISDTNLTGVEVVQKNEALPITNTNISECGVNNINLNCVEISNTAVGLIEYVAEGPKWNIGFLEYNATDPNATIINVYETLDTNIPADIWPSGKIMYTTYEKFDVNKNVNVKYTGEMQYCVSGLPTNPGGLAPPLRIDLIDPPAAGGEVSIDEYNSGSLKRITTKIAQSGAPLTAVHLDGDGVASLFTSSQASLQVIVMPLLSNADCTSQQNLYMPDGVTPAVLTIPSGSVSTTETIAIPSIARKDSRFLIKYLDLQGLYTETGQECIKDMLNADGTLNTTTGNLAGLSQCVNSVDQYRLAYGESATNRCFGGNGEPCLSTNGGYSCGPDNDTCPGYNPIYDNELGCLMCTLDIMPDCSSDNFAIRPNEFDSSLSAATVVKAKEPTNITFNAFTFDGATPTPLYNESQTDSFDVTLSIIDTSAVCAFPTFDLSPDVVFADGTVTADYTFDHVGYVTMKISEIPGSEYALVDADDTLDADRYITPWTESLTITPDHFDLNVTYKDANYEFNSDKNFTYLSDGGDGFNMMSMLDFNITAKDFDNVKTANYDGQCAAQDMNVTLTHSAVPSPLTEFVTRLQAKYVTALPVDRNISVADDITFTSALAKSLPKEFFLNGDGFIEMLINFDRKTDLPLNPFKFTINDITIVDENGTTTQTSPQAINEDATFFYARVHSPRSRAMCTTAGGSCTGNINFYYEVYAKSPTAVEQGLITTLLGNVPKKSLDSVNWYRNTEHDLSSDGNVSGSSTLIPVGTAPTYTPNPTLVATTAAYNYTGSKGYPYKGTVTVDTTVAVTADANQTQPWLIYDQFNPHPATTNSVELEFYGPGAWSSDTGAAESVTDSGNKKNKNTNRRIRW
ncbi:hypothetical protein [Sulfurovum sp.]|uniref:hypothetical protein n=1 Tax=Sulfurovum sp. TaxID=1969726 RepID=UPI00356B3E21